MKFPSPESSDPDVRFEEATNNAYEALEQLLAAASGSGWDTHEVTEAFLLAAESLKVANTPEPDPADDQFKRTI